MDRWNPFFATTGIELDIRDAVLALERVLELPELGVSTRITLEAAAAVLRELDAAPPGQAGVDPSGTPRHSH
jgi:hypothetical protein